MSELDQLQQEYTLQMSDFEERLKIATGMVDDKSKDNLNSLQIEFINFKIRTMSLLQCMQLKIGNMENRIDALERRSRRKQLLFHGIPETATDDPKKLVTTICVDKIKLASFDHSLIEAAFRIGKVSKDKPRPILLTLNSLQAKNTIWSNKKSLKGSNILVTESLTHSTQRIYSDARKHFPLGSTWTLDGKVIVLFADSTKRTISTEAQLRDAIEHLNTFGASETGKRELRPKKQIAAKKR